MYHPNRWVVLKINQPDQIHYKVLGGWSGGYLDGASWRLNSGIVKVREDEDHFYFTGYSGSEYKCSKASYGCNNIMAGILSQFLERAPNGAIEILAEDTDWHKINWNL